MAACGKSGCKTPKTTAKAPAPKPAPKGTGKAK